MRVAHIEPSHSGGLLLIFAALLLFVTPAHGQDQSPMGEVFGGYSFSSSTQQYNSETVRTNGWGMDLAGRLTKHLGIIADLAGQYGNANYGSTTFVEHDFLFGGRLSWTEGRLTGFVHGLAGLVHYNAYDSRYKTSYIHYPADTSFATAFGGGVDFIVAKKVAIRALKLDFMPVRTRPDWTRNIRVQTGIVWRFGS